MSQKAGRITSGELSMEITLERVDGASMDRISEAYRAKYSGSPCLAPLLGDGPRSATVRTVPRSA